MSEPMDWEQAERLIAALERIANALEKQPGLIERPGYSLSPEPKGYHCPACRHDTALHREHGCDVGECDCPAPFGRIKPGDA